MWSWIGSYDRLHTKVIEDVAGGDSKHTLQESKSRGAPETANLAPLMKKA
jgi:hypothetical protein